ncbi:MAG: phosphate propanoyltransferase [Oscillospiraceae bacterium]
MAEILIETSARHVHVTKETLEVLFGKGAELTKKKDLSQPGQYASEQRVTVVGPKKELANVSILGPCRNADQVELSATDARSIGLDIAIRESGDIAGTPGCTLKGPEGEVTIKEGVIVAKRHIHLTPETADKLGVKNKDTVWVKCNTNGRTAVLGDVVVRVSESFADAMHIDTDESNAISATPGIMGEIVKEL